MIDGADSLSKTPRVMSNDFAQTFLPVRHHITERY